MYCLAREVSERGRSVVTTTTTRIFPPAADQSPCLLLFSDDPDLAGLPSLLARFGHVTVGQSILEAGKVEGITGDAIKACLDRVDLVLIEADGAAGRSVKAPESWEPVIVDFADLVIPVVGLDCMGRPATEDRVFRLERFLSVTGLGKGEVITPGAVARLLSSPDGGLRGAPKSARVTPFLNKTDLLDRQWEIDAIARMILDRGGGRIERVVAGSLKERIGSRFYWRPYNDS